MGFKAIEKQLNGLLLLEPDVFQDERGFFMESFRENAFKELGIDSNFIQENHSRSTLGVLRGMHFQWDPPQGKLIRVTIGRALVTEVDIRRNSPTFGKFWTGEISAENKQILWVPPGFANGFLVLSDICEMQYKCTSYWNKAGEGSLLWNDPEIGINWNFENPILSEKDANALPLSEWLKTEVPYFRK